MFHSETSRFFVNINAGRVQQEALQIYRSACNFPRSAPAFRRSATNIPTKTLKPKSHRHRRRDGVHDAGDEERLGHIQLAAVAEDVGERGEGARRRRARAEGVGVAVGGPGAVAALGRRAEPAPLGAGHALAVLLPRAALARLAAPRRQPQGLG